MDATRFRWGGKIFLGNDRYLARLGKIDSVCVRLGLFLFALVGSGVGVGHGSPS
jgi:hypothetical protein